MYKVIALTKFKPGMSLTDARKHWREVHGALAVKVPFIERYYQNQWLTPLDEVGPGNAGPADTVAQRLRFDGNSQIWYADEEAYLKAMSSHEWAVLLEDAVNVFDFDSFVSAIIEDHVLRDDLAADTGFKVIWLVKYKADLERKATDRHYLEVHGEIALRVPGVLRYEQNHGVKSADVEGLTEDSVPFDGKYDGYSEAWWADEASYLAALESPEWAELVADGGTFIDVNHLDGAVCRNVVIRP
jgi:uncharacterized protein (TIGR02118 family)